MTAEEDASSPELALGRVVRAGLLAGIAGIAAGAVAAFAGRVAMRILALANSELDGTFTENGNLSGEITAGGTFALVFFVAVFTGLPGGFLYAAIRSWLPGRGAVRGLVYGVLLLLVAGTSTVFDPDNVDFRLFGPAGLAVGLLGPVFLAYGAVVGALADRLDPYVPPLFERPGLTWLGRAALAAASVAGLVVLVRALEQIL